MPPAANCIHIGSGFCGVDKDDGVKEEAAWAWPGTLINGWDGAEAAANWLN